MNNSDKKEFKRLQKCRLKSQAGGKLKEEAEFCNLIGELLAKSGEYHEAIKEHRNEMQICESLNDINGAGVANRKIGECLSELGEYQKALKFQRKHLRLAESNDNILEQQRALATIGRTYLCWADNPETDNAEKMDVLPEAQKAFLRSLSLCDDPALRAQISERELSEMRARLLLNLGLVHESLGSGKNAAHFIQKAIFIAEKHKLLEDLYRCHLSLGDVHQRAGNYSKAGRSMENALLVAKKMKNKELEAQCLLASANVFFQKGDFTAAKRSLKKAYKLGGQMAEERENLIRFLKTAVRCVQLQGKLDTLPLDDVASQLPVCEALGDLCCKVDSYKRAIEFYKKQLECAKTLSKPDKELASIYISLAATYADDGQHQPAILMYHNELKLRKGNRKEETKTWLNIADMQEKAGESFDVIQKSYTKALECAKQADHPRLQIQALRSQLNLIERHNIEHLLRPTQKMLRSLREENDVGSDDELEVSDDDDSQMMTDSEQLGDSLDVQLDDLSDSDSSSDEEYDRPTASERVRRSKFSKLNEKGESLLHRACIAGNLKQVKKLVQQGHPMNTRDYCGWTPLHEASNHGYVDIVRVLVSHGADINDRGGEKCDGVTPLLDAVNCGNWSVARLLIESGANAEARDNFGHTPLDALKTWLESYSSEIDSATREECFEVARLLREGVPSGGNTTLGHARPVHKLQPQGFNLNSDLFDREEDPASQMSQRSTQQSKKVSPHGGNRQDHKRRDDQRWAHTERRRPSDAGGVAKHRAVASRRNAALSLDDSSDDDYDNDGARNKDVMLMSCSDEDGGDDADDYAHNSSRRRRSSEDSLPDVDIGSRPSSRIRSASNQSEDERDGVSSSIPQASSRVPGLGRALVESDEDAAPSSYRQNILPQGDVDCPTNARKTYKDVMREIGSAATRLTGDPGSGSIGLKPGRPEPQSALIPETEYTGDEDWLVDDVVAKPSKRQRVDIDGTFRSMPSERTNRNDSHVPGSILDHGVSGTQSSSRSSSRMLSRKSKPKQVKLTSLGVSVQQQRSQRPSSRSSNIQDFIEDDDFVIEEFPIQPERVSASVSPHQHSSSASGTTGGEQRSLVPGPSSMMRVKVKIQDKLFLIPVNLRDRPSMQWLSEQAATRYYSQCGLRPKLSLCTPEGALFSAEDSVVDLLNNNETVVGRVDSWDLPPLTERYRKACQRTDSAVHPEILSRLQTCQTQQQQQLPTLDLSDLHLRPAPISPLLTALQCQYSLRRLLLSGNRLANSAAPLLAAALKTLPNLTELNLSCCELSPEGVRGIADILDGTDTAATGNGVGGMTGGDKPLQLLEELDLSYNYLTDASALSLATVVKHCPLLTSLAIRSCDLTAKFFQLHRHKLVQAFQGAYSLSTLLVSHNHLGSTGVELLLGCLAKPAVQHLDLSNVIASRSDGIHIARHLSKYFAEAPVLDQLQLSGCHISDVDLDYLKRLQPSSKRWALLDLSANPRLTSAAVSDLLHSFSADSISTSKLDLSGCHIQSPLHTPLLDAFTKLLPDPSEVRGQERGQGDADPGSLGLVELNLSGTGLNKVDRELLMNVWNVAHGARAGHHIDSKRCIFFVTEL